jgi:TonB family protein
MEKKMPVNGFDWVRRLVDSAMISAALMIGFSLPTIGDSSDEPIDVSKLDRGPCASGQVSTDPGCMTLPKLTKRVMPQYPPRARQAHMKGKVTLAIFVELDGKVSSPTVEKSTRPGFGFEEASIHAVNQWQYKPARVGDKTLRVRYEVIMEFSLP